VTAQIITQFAQDRFYSHYIGHAIKQAKLDHGGLGGVLSVRLLESLSLSTAVRGDKYQGIPVAPTWRVGGEYGLYDIIFKGGIATGFKAPTLSQRYDKGPRHDGNPSLKPEKSLGWDVGAERSFFNQKLALGVTLFQNRTRDMIAWAGNTQVNCAKVRSHGFEGITKLQITNDWGMELTHTYMEVWDLTHLAMVRRPHNKTTLKVIGQITPEWQVSANVLYVGGQYDLKFDALTFTSTRIKMPSYTIFGVETSYQLNEQWQAYGRGENLTNRRYENPYGFQQPGLGVYVGLRLKC
jgi:vitamin B12 transporter